MFRSFELLLATGLIVSMALFAGPRQALAHDRPGASMHVTGLVTAVRGGTLQLQTRTGPVSVEVSSRTHIVREVAGTTADLKVGAHVSLHLARGTTNITSIQIDATGNRGPLDGNTPPIWNDYPPLWGTEGTMARPAARNRRPVLGGQIIALRGNALTIRGFHGRTATYTLASGVRITKHMNGKLSDLASGEMVAVDRSASGPAVTVEILSA